jgi:TIR domain
MPDPSHDVFMSYNSEDREAVESIAVYLADNIGLRPWLDQWNLIPGEPWLQRLERGLASAKSCAVFVGQNGEGPWQDKEMAGVSHLLHTKRPSHLRAFLDKLGNVEGEVLDRLIDLDVVLPGCGRPDAVVVFLKPSQPPHS